MFFKYERTEERKSMIITLDDKQNRKTKNDSYIVRMIVEYHV